MTYDALTAPVPSRMLRTVLRIDSIAGLVSGAGLVAAAPTYADLFGLPVAVAVPVGLFLVALAGFIWFAATRLDAWAVTAVIVTNVYWVLLSAVVLATGAMPLTTAGTVFVVAQAAGVGLLAELQYVGLRRTRR
ncbi:hypothetical protein ACFQY4_18360 [Catellatospora bangladeshensis]|uniref:Integral membrane protein n=1 Tax=Catellatospora bangladeshensis TaxID=310355 RepID=A0A8J3JQI4_9ACTN|nr:hypothetical protein [Catellatospora bangladeshensis]GIF82024.1 hypothetical protein Cba03nite_33730 [Catellatospora bangladeshensis]